LDNEDDGILSPVGSKSSNKRGKGDEEEKNNHNERGRNSA
jgi:hypothetical protein